MTTLPIPFAYATTPHVRRHGPRGYVNYASYKPFLRDEFSFRCVFCLERERFYPNRHGSFSADHFIPKLINPKNETDYTNLVYACLRCNSYKQMKTLSLDPTKVAFAEHFRIKEDGHIEGLSAEARDLIDVLHLDEGAALEIRQHVLSILGLKRADPDNPVIEKILLYYLSFPVDLPDLSSLRPPENDKKGGIQESYFERKRRGELPAIY